MLTVTTAFPNVGEIVNSVIFSPSWLNRRFLLCKSQSIQFVAIIVASRTTYGPLDSRRRISSSPVFVSHNQTSPSDETEASLVPYGLNAKCTTLVPDLLTSRV